MGNFWLAASKTSGVGSPSSTPGVGAPINPLSDASSFVATGDERILYVDSLSSDLDCAKFMDRFGKYGEIKVIKFCETDDFAFWRLWIEFATQRSQ